MTDAKKKPAIQDPHAEREAQKYANPIPSREFLLELLQDVGKPVSYAYLRNSLQLGNPEQAEALQRRLRAMERDGQLMRNRRGKYGLVEKMDLLRGTVIGHHDGFGFVKLDRGGDDVFLNPQQMRMVFDGDKVLIRIGKTTARGKLEGVVVDILERGLKHLVGRLIIDGGIAFLTPDNKRINRDILIPPTELHGAVAGQMVVVELIIPEVPDYRRQPLGRVIEILGEHMAPGMEIDVAIRAHNLPHLWPDDVAEQVKSFGTKVTKKDLTKDRVDLRNLFFVTIDGEDAKDFDDAVYTEKLPKGGWKLYVAIADVSHYVLPDTPLDREAQIRGNSVYFPGRVIPMLPEILSNELCSLKPLVDRLCMVCEAHISSAGKIRSYEFYPAVIHSQARLTYNQVAMMLEDRVAKTREKCLPHIQELNHLFKKLLEQRISRGAIDFDFPEPRIVFDDNRKIEKIVPLIRNDAHRLIEECMLVANVCAAGILEKSDVPGLFRVHEGPNSEKLRDLRTFLREVGLKLEGEDEPEPGHYADVLKAIVDRDDVRLIETVLLRSLSQAIYTEKNNGHFGLAFDAYAHFTSPIRRYPDLLVHRAIKFILSKSKKKTFHYNVEQMSALGAHCSMTERRADDATRGAIAWLKCEFMQDKLGQEFFGRITSVTAFGIFIELEKFFVEGLLHVTALKSDYYHFDAIHHCLRGERSGRTYRIGDRIEIRVARVNLEDKKIDFVLAGEAETKSSTKEKKTRQPQAKKKAGRKRRRR